MKIRARPEPEHAVVPGAVASLDREIVDQLQQLMGDGFDDLIATYLRDAPTQLMAMKSAVVRNDREALERSAHTLKSTSAALGALQLGALAAAIEAASREQPTLRDAVTPIAIAEDEFESVRSELLKRSAGP